MSSRRGGASDLPGRPELDLSVDAPQTVSLLQGFIASELSRTGLQQVVLGLSGGLDSAVAAYLAAGALGPASVRAVLMPYRSSAPDSVADAERVVEALGIPAETIDISVFVDGFTQTVGDVGAHRLGNVMARARMTVLYDRSEAHRALVLGTSNKTELLLGYGTLHGDLASAINPLGDLYKTQVRQLAQHLGVPVSIRRKPPSADLSPDQTDEDELGMTYDDADRILALQIDARCSRDTVVEAGFDPELVDRIAATVRRTQFKRRLPLIAKVSTRSIGWDFRYPRDWGN